MRSTIDELIKNNENLLAGIYILIQGLKESNNSQALATWDKYREKDANKAGDEKDEKTAEDHWNYIEVLTRATMPAAGNTAADFTIDELIALIGFHYKSAFIHGWKHAIEAQKQENTAYECCRPVPRSAEGNLGAAVSAVSGSARRACDADNSVEAGAPIKESAEYIFDNFLREDR